jgi:hypothetical protein
MEILFTVAVVAGLFLAIEVLWFPPSWLGRFAARVARREPARDGEQPGAAGTAQDGPGQADDTALEWGLFTRSFIRGRLDALAEELDRLDRDPDVFARAFHTMAARAAYEALLADASRLADRSRRYAGQTLDFELVSPSTGRREELEL